MYSHYYAHDPMIGDYGRPAPSRQSVATQEPATPKPPRPQPHRGQFTVDKAGFELVVAGPFGIPHGTTGWKNGKRHFFNRKWNHPPHDGEWLTEVEYRHVKLISRAPKSRKLDRLGWL